MTGKPRESDYGLVTRDFEAVADEFIVAAVSAAASSPGSVPHEQNIEKPAHGETEPTATLAPTESEPEAQEMKVQVPESDSKATKKATVTTPTNK